MRLIRTRAVFPLTVTAAAAVFLGVFLLYPLAQVFTASFLNPAGTALTLANYVKVLSTPFYLAGLGNSLLIGAWATALTMLIGVPMAFVVARLPIPGRAVLLAVSVLPLVLPSFVGAY